jgi:hypothetical protein
VIQIVGGANHSRVLHSLFQFLAFDKGLSGLDRRELVGHSDIVGIVGRLVDYVVPNKGQSNGCR